MFSYDHLYIGGGNARRLDIRQLPANAKLVSNANGVIGGAALWNDGVPDELRDDGEHGLASTAPRASTN
jgi:hypothetical protein